MSTSMAFQTRVVESAQRNVCVYHFKLDTSLIVSSEFSKTGIVIGKKEISVRLVSPLVFEVQIANPGKNIVTVFINTNVVGVIYTHNIVKDGETVELIRDTIVGDLIFVEVTVLY